jgi:hypothetical protein
VLGSLPPAQAAEKNPALDPRAVRIFKAALQNVAATPSFTFQAEVIKEVPLDSGQRIQQISTLKSFVRRPDRMAAIREGEGRSDGGMFYDGKIFSLWNKAENVYGQWEAPATIDKLLDTMKDKLGFLPPLAVLIRSDTGSGGREKEIKAATYVGRTSIRGVDCHHLAFSGENADLQVWITDGVPVIKRFVVTYKKKAGAPQFTATFLDWNFNAQLSDYVFAFDPPAGARKIEFKVVDTQ